jgi:predicted TIM-barrel fold metal-dependent hydrolase
MTRRELLLISSAAVLKPAEPSFERIDTHNHIHHSCPELVAAMKNARWKGLSICDSRAIGNEPSILNEMREGTIQFVRESAGRWSWATTFDARDFESPEFASRVTADLKRGFDRGAIAVKLWKNVGIAIRSKSGEYLMPDSPALAFVFEFIQKSGKTLITHLADPDQAWLPLDPNSPDSSYYRSHPEWALYGRKDVPSKEAILAARDRTLSRYPRLRVIGAHLGSNEDNLELLAPRLDRFPNFAVDLAARLRHLTRGDFDKVRQFLLKYQDRLIYATDFTLRDNDCAKAAQSLLQTHEADWQLLAGRGKMTYSGREVNGFDLPETALRKIFRENALRWLPGM